MNTVNVSERLPPIPESGQVSYYPVVYKPASGGYHLTKEKVGWDGKNWQLTEGTVVVWVDPKPIETVLGVGTPKEASVIAPIEDENATYSINLTTFEAAKKIGVIKLVRELNGLSLGDSKTFVESFPKILKTGVSKKEAAELKAKIEAVGASCEIKTE